MSDQAKYMLVTGAVAGGGLKICSSSRAFMGFLGFPFLPGSGTFFSSDISDIFSTLSNKDKTMRTYPPDSPEAVSRLLALTVIIDGGGSPPEITATYRHGILDYAGIQEDVFDQVLQEMRTDLPTTPDGLVRVETEVIDQLLAEIVRPDLRLSLWKAMWQLAYADDELADAEIALLLRATNTWGIESGVDGSVK